MPFLWRHGVITRARGGGRKCPRPDRSLFEDRSALRAFLGALVDVGAAVRAREGRGLAGLLALRRFDRFHLRFRFLLRDLRLGAEHPGPRRPLTVRVTPLEYDDEIE